MDDSPSAKVDIAFLATCLILSGRHAKLIFMVLGAMPTIDTGKSVTIWILYVFVTSTKAGHAV